MNILHVTDLHFNKRFFDWVYDCRHGYDAVCITGDFLNTQLSCDTPLDEQIAWISSWLRKFDTPLFACSGNHDCRLTPSLDINDLFSGYEDDDLPDSDFATELGADWLFNISNPWFYADYSIKELHGIVMGSIPYGLEEYERFSQCDVLLHHLPPAKTSTSDMNGQDWGSTALRNALDCGTIKPGYLLCGHVHRPKESVTMVGNCSIINPGAILKAAAPAYQVIRV